MVMRALSIDGKWLVRWTRGSRGYASVAELVEAAERSPALVFQTSGCGFKSRQAHLAVTITLVLRGEYGWRCRFGESSNGKTEDFESSNVGSTPTSPALSP